MATISDTRSERHVVVVLQGGLGNQLFQLVGGETIRRCTGYPVLYDCDRAFRQDPFGRQFELKHMIPPERRARPISRPPLLERIESAIETRVMWKLGISSLPLRAMLLAANRWPGSEVVFRSHFQSLEYVDRATVESIRRAMNLRVENPIPEVAIHFRRERDRYATGAQAREHANTVLPLGYYRECLRRIRSAESAPRFRVFSDQGIVPADVFQPGDKVFLDEPSEAGSPWDTLARMARCHHFVVANSTLSWWAAYLSRAADKRVYIPSRWGFANGAPPQRGIFPEAWQRVQA